MPRIRTVKPEFWDSPSTARANYRARLFFMAMWNWADDYGIGTANPKALIGFAFPNDDDVSVADFPTLRKEVADAFGVRFYEVDGRPYYAIPSWDKHQRTERKAKGVNPPPPPETQGVGSSDDPQGTSAADDGGSGLGTGEQGNSLAPEKPARQRTPDKMFEALAEACGIDWHNLTESGRGQLVGALKQIRAVGAIPDDIRRRAEVFNQRFQNATLTPTALAKHWASLAPAAPKPPGPPDPLESARR